MDLPSLKINRNLYKSDPIPMSENPVHESTTVGSNKKMGSGQKNGNTKEVESGTVISSCFVRTSEKETRVELVPFSFDTSGADVFGEATYIDALIAWRGVNDPAVVIDQHGILATEIFVLEDLTVQGDLTAINLVVGGNFTYQGSLMPRIYWGLINTDGTAISLPTGWSSSSSGTGIYTVTHNLGATGNYAINITPYQVSALIRLPTLNGIGANSFDYVVRDSSGNPVDTIIAFSVFGNFL